MHLSGRFMATLRSGGYGFAYSPDSARAVDPAFSRFFESEDGGYGFEADPMITVFDFAERTRVILEYREVLAPPDFAAWTADRRFAVAGLTPGDGRGAGVRQAPDVVIYDLGRRTRTAGIGSLATPSVWKAYRATMDSVRKVAGKGRW
jgi:hypothetical protein